MLDLIDANEDNITVQIKGLNKKTGYSTYINTAVLRPIFDNYYSFYDGDAINFTASNAFILVNQDGYQPSSEEIVSYCPTYSNIYGTITDKLA